MTLITPDKISYQATISEDDLRARMGREVLESIGALGLDGKPLPGVRVTVKRGPGRAGRYSITAGGPMPARLLIAED